MFPNAGLQKEKKHLFHLSAMQLGPPHDQEEAKWPVLSVQEVKGSPISCLCGWIWFRCFEHPGRSMEQGEKLLPEAQDLPRYARATEPKT